MGNIISKKITTYKSNKKLYNKILKISTSQEFTTASLTPQKSINVSVDC
jgi:hypothetical protein